MNKNITALVIKKTIITMIFLASSLYATVTNEYPSQKILNSKIPIVDIRTPGEWKSTGLLKGAIPIMFFNERGGYDLNGFLKELMSKVDVKKPFALICRSGSRTATISQHLSNAYGYNVINIQGGMIVAKSKNLPITPYR